MGSIPVLQQGRDEPVCLADSDLPDFYMEDYSRLGLLVASLDRAYQILVDHDFTMHQKSEHFEITVDHAYQMPEIINLLGQNGIDCVMADIVDQVYQG